MSAILNRIRDLLRELWTTSPALTGAGVFMLVVLVPSLAGVAIDSRVITGAPAWLKPAKFAVSTAIYMLTLAWVFTHLSEWPRMRRFVGGMTAIILVLEVAIIDLQAWRGTTSHFNVATVLDGALFSIMGLAIVVQTVTSISVAVALWRQPFADRALGWALRLGMALTIVGASTGGLMTRPTPAQLDQVRQTGRMPIAGAHTVGAPDGGAGLPGTGWSREHGDLRVPHFIGLHALQVLPVLALLGRRRWRDAARVRLLFVAAASYAWLFGILLSQALRGQSLLQPDSVTLVILGLWAILTAVGVRLALSRQTSVPSRALVLP
jgi:hypothetical protein